MKRFTVRILLPMLLAVPLLAMLVLFTLGQAAQRAAMVTMDKVLEWDR